MLDMFTVDKSCEIIPSFSVPVRLGMQPFTSEVGGSRNIEVERMEGSQENEASNLRENQFDLVTPAIAKGRQSQESGGKFEWKDDVAEELIFWYVCMFVRM